MPRTKPRPLKPPASRNGLGETPEVLTLEEAAMLREIYARRRRPECEQE